MLKKTIILLLTLFVVGCSSNTSNTTSLNIQYDDDVVMIKEGYEHVIGNDVIEFLNTLTLLETDETVGMEVSKLVLDKEIVVYSDLVLKYDNVLYKIQNDVSEEYYWMVFNSNILSVNEITDTYKFDKVVIEGLGDYELEVLLKDNAKQLFVDSLSKLVILEYGIVERGAGGYTYKILFEGASIEEGNGVYLYKGNELVTNKQSVFLNGSIQNLLDNLIPENIKKNEPYEDDNVIITSINNNK